MIVIAFSGLEEMRLTGDNTKNITDDPVCAKSGKAAAAAAAVTPLTPCLGKAPGRVHRTVLVKMS